MIQSIPVSERPRERCLSRGASVLSLRECLALILNSGPKGVGCAGLAASLLSRVAQGMPPEEEERAFFTSLEASPDACLQGIPGLGPAARARVLAAFELGRRYAMAREKSRALPPPARSSRSSWLAAAARGIPTDLRHEPQEWLGFVPLHRSGHWGELCVVERGVRTHVNTDPAELFARLLALRPQGFILVHNHPSGNPLPSETDHELTRTVSRVARQLNIRLYSHLVVAGSG